MTFSRSGIGSPYKTFFKVDRYRPFTGIPNNLKPMKTNNKRYRHIQAKVDSNRSKRATPLKKIVSKNKWKKVSAQSRVERVVKLNQNETNSQKANNEPTYTDLEIECLEETEKPVNLEKSETFIISAIPPSTSLLVTDSVKEKDDELNEVRIDLTASSTNPNNMEFSNSKLAECYKFPKWLICPKCRLPATVKNALMNTAPTLALIFVSFLFALFFWVVENHSYSVQNPKLKCKVTFWDSLYFINTLHTTIGYGTVVPCSNGGRGLTIGYVFIGLPCMLIFLNKVSKTLLAFVHWLDIMLNRWRRKKDINPKPNIMLGMVIAIMWILIFAATVYHVDSYFTQSATENYFGAFYFIIITLTTIGLGDIDFKDRHLAVAYFAMVFMGYAMVSMVLQLFQEKMEEILQEMIEEAKAAQAAVEIKDMESGEKIISPQSYKFLAMFLTEAQQAKLEEAIKEKAEAASQTHIETVNKSTRTGMDVVTPNWKLMKISGFDELEFQSEVRNSSK